MFVKTIGDAVMLAFANPSQAVMCLRQPFDAALADSTLPLIRAGAHDGPAVEDSGDFFGATVNLAARVAARAAGGHLLGTDAVAFAARDAGEVVTHVGAVALCLHHAERELFFCGLPCVAQHAAAPGHYAGPLHASG